MMWPKSLLPKIPVVVERYGLAVLSVAAALAFSLFLYNHKFEGIVFPFLIAVAVTVWYAGVGPGILALVLASLSFNYYFVEPRYTFYINRSDLPYYVLFVFFTLLITLFAAVRRRVEQNLRESRDELQREVAIRTQQASLLNLTHDTIFVRDMNDVITYWNRGAQELYGWSAEEVIGKRAHDLLKTIFSASTEDRLTDRAEAIRADLLRMGRWDGELRQTKADGTEVVVSSRWSLQRDEQGSPVAVLETNNDITERKRRENQIRGLNHELGKRSAELEGSNKELEAFAYSVSHDLRAPLRHMVGYTELLQKHSSSTLDDKGRRYMKTILEAAKQMGTLIDDLLAFSRIGRAETRETMVSMDQLVQEVQSEVFHETEGRNITWKVGALPDLYGDRSMLKLVLVNLVANAIKFTRTRSAPEIEIGSRDTTLDSVVVFVKDNGVGFDMKYGNKLFGVFQRLHRANEFEGTGIGLATVQRIVHRHGGRVWAEGQVGSGATFYLSIPRP